LTAYCVQGTNKIEGRIVLPIVIAIIALAGVVTVLFFSRTWKAKRKAAETGAAWRWRVSIGGAVGKILAGLHVGWRKGLKKNDEEAVPMEN